MFVVTDFVFVLYPHACTYSLMIGTGYVELQEVCKVVYTSITMVWCMYNCVY